MQLLKALACILGKEEEEEEKKKRLVFEEPQNFKEERDYINHLGSLVQKKIKGHILKLYLD